MLFLSVLLVGLLGIYVNDSVLERVREQRLESTLGELRARLETDLRIGLELPDNERAQALIEDAVARTPMLQSIEIDSEQGTVLFDSDRVLRGKQAPDSWRRAARADPEGWHVLRQDELSIGMPLHDVLGETAGYLVSTYEVARDNAPARNVLLRVLWVAVVAAVVALLAAVLVARLTMVRRAADLARLRDARVAVAGDALAAAGRVLVDARDALAEAEEHAQRLAGIES